MASTKYGDIPPRVGIALDTKALAHAQPVLVLQKFGQHRPIGANKGQLLKMRRALPFPAATTPITEGVRPTGQQLVYQDVTFTLAQYGAFAPFTDAVEDTHEDPVLSDLTTLSGEQAAETVEKVLIGNLIGGTNVLYSNGASRAAVNTKVTLATQRKATRALKAARGKKITKILSASVSIGTKPVEASYIAFAHTDTEADIRGIAGFKSVSEYGSMQPLCPEEIGSVEDVRYILTQNLGPWINAGGTPGGTVLSTGGSSADVYPILYVAEDAYGVTPLKGKEAVNMMVLKPGTPRFGDELGQWGSVGWKTWHASGILNNTWMVRAEVAATAL
ncbi:MAG TPA: N4-gp56 family major capsid protein [Cellvibrio sp.]|nr:N4-gp56 family major capsid protein [Cellvibrio sp.]